MTDEKQLPDTANAPMEDVQGRPDPRRIPINKVGIKDIRHPISVETRDGDTLHTVANYSMYVNLPGDVKGTHMSRFIEIINVNERVINNVTFADMIRNVTERLEAKSSYVELDYRYFVKKTAPVSGEQSMMDYEVKLWGEQHGDDVTITTEVLVPVASLCPCSKKISEYGAHNQRSHIIIKVRGDESIRVEDLIDIAEQQASCELYGILKRPDEKHVTERAYENPKFVEDMVRDVAAALNADDRIDYYYLSSENFESIHNHSAFAIIEVDKRA